MADLTTLDEAVSAAVAQLGRFGAAYPVYLAPPSGHEIVRATELLEPIALRAASERSIREWTARPQDEDIRAAVSRFARRYCGSIAAAALVPLANGVAFDVGLERVAFVIRNDMPMGVVLGIDSVPPIVSPSRPTGWPHEEARSVPSLSALREAALGSLFGEHLQPAFDAILREIHVSPRLLWSTAAEQIDLLYESAVESLDPRSNEPFQADREAILFAGELPGLSRPNPMRDLLFWETADDPAFPRPLQVRRVCCVNYVVPGRPNTWCRTCGLISPEERLELWRSFRAGLAR